MFGKLLEIKDAFPNFMLDYQERGVSPAAPRWTDRVTTDGSWSGNLYDFYHLVIRRLTRDVKVPFRLEAGTRIDDTPVHEALREALVNTLIHADYTGRIAVLVVKRPDLFFFRNPGALRMPVETAMQGGVSDCRNRRLQDMFRYVGLGEQAGSGIAKIESAWRGQHWRAPSLLDMVDPYEETYFTLTMASLLPPDAVSALEARFGDSFRVASEVQKLALVTAAVEGKVTHARLRTMTDAHSRDLTVALASLVQKGMLESGREEGSASRKGTYYFLEGTPPPGTAVSVPFDASSVPLPDEPGGSSVLSGASSVLLASDRAGSVPSEAGSSTAQGANAPNTSLPLRPKPSLVDDAEWARLVGLAATVRDVGRAPREHVRDVLVELLAGHYLTLEELAWLTGRSSETLRIKYVSDLVAEGKLAPRYPDQPTHPGQAYTKAPEPKAP